MLLWKRMFGIILSISRYTSNGHFSTRSPVNMTHPITTTLSSFRKRVSLHSSFKRQKELKRRIPLRLRDRSLKNDLLGNQASDSRYSLLKVPVKRDLGWREVFLIGTIYLGKLLFNSQEVKGCIKILSRLLCRMFH